MKRVCLSFTFLIAPYLIAQTGPTNEAGKNVPAVFPPTPEAFKFGSYGNLPSGLFTGSPNFDIPITSFSLDNINIPIYLNYSSNGIKVDDTNGSVGLGWRFISGGIITRVIRDMPDEINTQNNPETPDIISLGLNNPTVTNYLTLCQNDDFDSELDLYMANFAGRNLRFNIKKNGEIIQIDKSGCKIERSNGGFTIKTEDGTEYLFNDLEKVRNVMTNTGQHHGASLMNTSAWYLSKIKDQSNREVTIEYYDVNFTSTVGQSQSMLFTQANQQKYANATSSPDGSTACPLYCNLQSYIVPPSIGLISDSQQTVIGKQIKKIYDDNGNYIFFEYEQRNDDYNLLKTVKKYSGSLLENFNFQYDITVNDRVFLKSVTEMNSGRKYTLEYNNISGFPGKFDLGRDMWGYYNGVVNYNLIPQIYESGDPNAVFYNGADQNANATLGQWGLLKKITYPTGGSTTINYENHKLRKVVTIPAQQTTAGTETHNDRYTTVSSSQITITPAFDGLIQISGGNARYGEGNCTNSPLLQSGKQKAEITVYDLNGAIIASETYATDGGGVFTVYGQKNKPITIKATARFGCSFASALATYYISEPTQGYEDKLLGGYRVASTKDEPINGDPIIKNYEYTKINGDYSTVEAYPPYFLAHRRNVSVCQGSNCQPPIDYYDSVLTSSNLNQYNSQNPNIFYSRVVENLGTRGKISHEFDTSIDEFGGVGGDGIAGTTHSNTGWKSGKELITTFLDKNGNIVRKIENNYAEDNVGVNINFSLATNKKYESSGTTGGMGQFDNLDYVLYKNISRFSYLKDEKTTDYLNGIPVLTQTEYFYNNPSHFQLTREKTTSPDGVITETNYSYAHEKGNQLMIDKNMVGIPLETTETQAIGTVTKTLGRTESIYPTSVPTAQAGNLVLPLSVKSYDTLNNAASTDLTYDKYDEKGNILQYTTKEGLPIAIVWGYNKTQPIAKIEGITYDQLMVAVSISAIVEASDQDASNPASEDQLLVSLNDFRKQTALLGKPITTFTYDPLIGVTSITPPTGIREVYSYDTANRLKEVKIREKDNTGAYVYRKVKDFNYKYKQ